MNNKFNFACPVLLWNRDSIHITSKLCCFCLQIWWVWCLPSDSQSTYWCWICTDNCGARGSSSYLSWRYYIYFTFSRHFFYTKKRKKNERCDMRKTCVWVQKNLRTYVSEWGWGCPSCNLMHVHLSRSQVVKSLFVHSDIFFKHKHMVHVAWLKYFSILGLSTLWYHSVISLPELSEHVITEVIEFLTYTILLYISR